MAFICMVRNNIKMVLLKIPVPELYRRNFLVSFKKLHEI